MVWCLISRAQRNIELIVLFLFFLLFPNLNLLLFQLVFPTSPLSIGELLWFELTLSALALALTVARGLARGLVSDGTVRWVGRACWALLSAGVIALCLSGVEAIVQHSLWVISSGLFILLLLKLRGAPREPVEQPTTEELYRRLLDAYLHVWGGPPERARARLERDIERLVERGLSREEAVKKLYR